MNKITFPLNPGMLGAAVVDLQDALQLFLDRSVILADDPVARQALSVKLKVERNGQVYRDTTQKLVNIFQETRQVVPNGGVDEATAKAINAKLSALATDLRTVRGVVLDANGKPSTNGFVQLFSQGSNGEQDIGKSAINAADGSYQISYPPPPNSNGRIDLRVAVAFSDAT